MGEKFKELELMLEGQGDDLSIREHVQYPAYLNAYENALRTIFLDTLRSREEELAEKENSFYRHKEEKENIIAFLGERGSGKTTAVEEFCRILETLSAKKEYRWWLDHAIPEENIRTNLEDQQYSFHVFQRIDVSMLDNKEDLFELIMSNLLTFFTDREFCSCCGAKKTSKEHDEIVQLFDKILRGYYAIRDSREDEYVESYVAKIQYVYNSLDLRRQIEELINRIFAEEKECKKQYYLVIVLDDLDLNIEHGFEMLKQVQKYFSNPHMIVVFSADYDQLNEICWVHFMKAFSGETSHVIEATIEQRSRKLGQDYIGKALPISKRLHMPELDSNVRKVLALNAQTERWETVKAYIMERVASNMRICYDIKGVKKHFAEPETVRDLVNYHHFLEEMYEIDYTSWDQTELNSKESRIFMKRYDQNHERMNRDIENRLANRLLNKEQKAYFDRWLDINLERRAESAWAFMYQPEAISDDERYGDSIGNYLGLQPDPDTSPAQNEQNQSYCFGALLKEIYTYGRNNAVNKAYVKCILASLTSEMVREKVSFSRNPDEDQRKESRKKLQRLFGNSFGDEWLGEMMPKRFDPDQLELRNTGYRQVSIAKIQTIDICPIPEEVLVEANNKSKRAIKGTVNELLNLLRKSQLVPSLEWVFMFASLRQEDGKLPITFEVETTENTLSDSYQERYVLQMTIDNEIWSIWEFIPKTLEFPNYLDRLHENLSTVLSELIAGRLGFKSKNSDFKEENREKILQWIKAKSLFKEETDEALNRPVFPFYQIDMAYNVLKRARRELLAENPEFCDRMELFSYMKSAYKKVEEKLKEEESEYKKLGIELKYAERFSTFPFVRMMVDDTYKNKVSQGILDCLQTILWGIKEEKPAVKMYPEDE